MPTPKSAHHGIKMLSDIYSLILVNKDRNTLCAGLTILLVLVQKGCMGDDVT